MKGGGREDRKVIPSYPEWEREGEGDLFGYVSIRFVVVARERREEKIDGIWQGGGGNM